MSNLPQVLQAKEDDIKMLLAAQSHLGSKNSQIGMSRYIYKTRPDGVNIINIGSTWEKLVLAARIIAAIENPQDVVVISSRNYGQRAALKFASNTGAIAVVGRFTPGTFTNYITRAFREPRLIIVTDPISDHQAILESSYVNVPVIAFADVDATLKHIDVAIPINNKGKHSVGVAWWLLAREVLRLRGTISRDEPWGVMVDMFFYRDPEEQKKEEELQEETDAQVVEDADATVSAQLPGAGNENWDGEWAGEGAATQDWADSTPAAGESNWD